MDNSQYASYIQVDDSLTKLFDGIRNEISNAILTAKLKHNFDKDVNLSFGNIHINPYGSVSTFSFNGADVTDIDKFIVTTALHVDSKNYFDIRKEIESNIDRFNFYPIIYKDKVYYTITKRSSYFRQLFGNLIDDHNSLKIKYAYKYIIFEISTNDKIENYVFLCGLFNPETTAKKLLIDAGRTAGTSAELYYCFDKNSKYLLKIGEAKPDFIGYEPRNGVDLFNFFKGKLESCVYLISRVKDNNSKIKIKESRKKASKLLIEMKYDGISNFCKMKSINEQTLMSFLSGFDNDPIYNNGNKITPTRLNELLNVNVDVSEEGLKDKKLLIKVKYSDIPDYQGDIYA